MKGTEEYPEERKTLAETGRKLLEAGLVARTWGNLSIRLNPEEFLITPSGRNYESLGAADMVVVSLKDLSWSGRMKPSSEKDLHARIYRNRDDVNAVIHTHQPAASSLAAARLDLNPTSGSGEPDSVNGPVPCVPYNLPTTCALAEAAEKTLLAAGPQCSAMLLSNHGALCTGADIDSALKAALELESAAELRISELYTPTETRNISPDEGRREQISAYLNENEGDRIYRFSGGRWTMAAAERGNDVQPMLDDLAQLIGINLPVVRVSGTRDFHRIRRILDRKGILGRSAVLIPGVGCLCTADNDEDAEAISMVVEKGCRASMESIALDRDFAISRSHALLMRMVYLTRYRKKAG